MKRFEKRQQRQPTGHAGRRTTTPRATQNHKSKQYGMYFPENSDLTPQHGNISAVLQRDFSTLAPVGIHDFPMRPMTTCSVLLSLGVCAIQF
jgi:hypothetical protein